MRFCLPSQCFFNGLASAKSLGRRIGLLFATFTTCGPCQPAQCPGPTFSHRRGRVASDSPAPPSLCADPDPPAAEGRALRKGGRALCEGRPGALRKGGRALCERAAGCFAEGRPGALRKGRRALCERAAGRSAKERPGALRWGGRRPSTHREKISAPPLLSPQVGYVVCYILYLELENPERVNLVNGETRD